MLQTWLAFLTENAAYIGFVLLWAAHLRSACSYGRMARLVRREQETCHTEGERNKEPVSVILTAHNQADELHRNLPLFLEQEYDTFEVIVVDNASTDETEDVLKQMELAYPNLRHTSIPPGTRYISQKRLSITIGIKSARYEWMLLAEPDSRPVSSGWLRSMARHFHPGIQIVLGYANYAPGKDSLSRKALFFNLFHEMQYLPWALRHPAYRCNPANLAYRKSLFMEHKGFAEDVNLVSGATELLVNRHSTGRNTAVSLLPESKVVCAVPVSAKQWKLKRTYYAETRRHFINTWHYRCAFNVKQAIVPLFYCAMVAALACSILSRQWIGTAAVALLSVQLCVCKTVWFNRSARAMGERPYYLSFLWNEARMWWWHACSWLRHQAAPRAIFRRKAF